MIAMFLRRVGCAILTLQFILLATIGANAQNLNDGETEEAKKPDMRRHGFLFPLSYGFNQPSGDLAARFGNFSDISLGAYYKSKTNWLIGLEGGYLFGDDVRENPLRGLLSSQGELIGNDGKPTLTNIYMRGFRLPMLKVGKILPLRILPKYADESSGLLFSIGAGYLGHQLYIIDRSQNQPQLAGDYSRGYDRFTHGFVLSEQVSLLYLDKRKWLNLMLTLEFSQGFTRNIRYNFDLRSKDDRLRTDHYVGMKLGWVLPVFGSREEEFYFY